MARRGRPPHPDVLTPREWEVLALLREHLTNEEIAARLDITLATAKFHVSEIISKLAVRDRHAAAAWQPEIASRRSFPALLVLRWLRTGPVPPVASAVAIVVVITAIALLAWGIASTRRGGGQEGWTVNAAAAGSKPSVLLFDLTKREAHRVAVSDSVSNARWLKPGESWLARVWDSGIVPTPPETDVTYRVYRSSGQSVWTVPAELTRSVIPAPDGNSVLIERIDNQYIIADVPKNKSGGFLSSARDLAFSRDGQRVAYTTVGGGDKDNVNHDWRSIIEGAKSDLTGYSGGGLAVQSQREADGLMDLPADPWSPDGAYLLVERDAPCAPPVAEPGNCRGPATFEVYGTQLTGKIFWKGYAGRLQSVQWAGPGQLFVRFVRGAERDPDFPDASALIVDLGLSKQPAPQILQASCCVSFSPDGALAVAQTAASGVSLPRCSLIDVTSGAELAGFDAASGDNSLFCGAASWTPDGSEALVSSGTGGT